MIAANFGSTAVATDPRVAPMVRSAAAALVCHAGRVARIQFDPGGAAGTASVTECEFRLAISVGVYSALRRRPPGEPIGEWQARRDAAPRELVVDVHADVEWILNQSLASEGRFGGEYASEEFIGEAGIGAAAAWVQENCHRVPVDRVSREEVAEWMKQTVGVPDPGIGDVLVPIPLGEAVRIFGPIYGRGVRAEILARNHRIRIEDARAIEDAIRRVLPRDA